MQLPFSVDQFFTVIRTYNEAVWPAQYLLNLLALAAFVIVVVRRPWSGMAASGILAFLWAWLGAVYHLAFFTSINPLAYLFGALSIVAAAVFAWQGVAKRRLEYQVGKNGRTVLGFSLVLFALVAYPTWSTVAGHAYPSLPTFGLPCPTTIFTIGILALARSPKVRTAIAIPILWSLVGGQAAFLLDVPPDLGLLAAGLIAIGLAIRPQPTQVPAGPAP